MVTGVLKGTTIQFSLRRLGLTEQPEHRVEQERKMVRLFTARAGLSRLQRMHREGLLADEMGWSLLCIAQALDPKNVERLAAAVRESTGVEVIVVD